MPTYTRTFVDLHNISFILNLFYGSAHNSGLRLNVCFCRATGAVQYDNDECR